jgi:hypothetical protein
LPFEKKKKNPEKIDDRFHNFVSSQPSKQAVVAALSHVAGILQNQERSLIKPTNHPPACPNASLTIHSNKDLREKRKKKTPSSKQPKPKGIPDVQELLLCKTPIPQLHSFPCMLSFPQFPLSKSTFWCYWKELVKIPADIHPFCSARSN